MNEFTQAYIQGLHVGVQKGAGLKSWVGDKVDAVKAFKPLESAQNAALAGGRLGAGVGAFYGGGLLGAAGTGIGALGGAFGGEEEIDPETGKPKKKRGLVARTLLGGLKGGLIGGTVGAVGGGLVGRGAGRTAAPELLDAFKQDVSNAGLDDPSLTGGDRAIQKAINAGMVDSMEGLNIGTMLDAYRGKIRNPDADAAQIFGTLSPEQRDSIMTDFVSGFKGSGQDQLSEASPMLGRASEWLGGTGAGQWLDGQTDDKLKQYFLSRLAGQQ